MISFCRIYASIYHVVWRQRLRRRLGFTVSMQDWYQQLDFDNISLICFSRSLFNTRSISSPSLIARLCRHTSSIAPMLHSCASPPESFGQLPSTPLAFFAASFFSEPMRPVKHSWLGARFVDSELFWWRRTLSPVYFRLWLKESYQSHLKS